MTAEIAAQLGPLMTDLLNETDAHGAHDQSFEIIETFIRRAYGIGKANPDNLPRLKAEFYAEAAQDGMHEKLIDLGEKYMDLAFDIGVLEAAAS